MESIAFKRDGKILYNKFRQYLIPTVFSGLSVMLGVMVDGIIVGNTIGAEAMAAVGVAQPLVLVFQAILTLFGVGGATLVAISKGERKNEKADAVFTCSILALLLSSLVFVFLGLFAPNVLVEILCNEDASLFALTKSYTQVLLLGAPLMIFVPGIVYIIRTDGFPRFSANILFVANIVNLLMDLVYILIFDLGIAGAALSTLTGYAVGLLMIVSYFFSKKRSLRLARLDKSCFTLFSEIMSNGLAGAVHTLLLVLKNLALNQIVLTVGGATAMAVYTVCNLSKTLITMFSRGASDTMVPILGMLYGERDWQGIRFLLKRTLTVLLSCLFVVVFLMFLFSKQILALFNITDPQVVSMGIQALNWFALSLIGLGIAFTLMYYLQTIKHRVISLTISLLRGIVLTVPLAFFLSRSIGLNGVWIAYVLSEVLTLLCTFIMCKITQMRSKNRYESVLLFEKQSETEAVYDITLQGQVKDAVAASESLIVFGQENGLSDTQANLIGLMVEDMVMYITQYNEGDKAMGIDFLCRIQEKEVVLSFRDDGKPFDAVPEEKTQEEAEFDNITVLRRLAKSVEYSRSLGINNTVLVLQRDLEAQP